MSMPIFCRLFRIHLSKNRIMTQERKRYYKKQQTDNISAASVEMGNVPPQAIDLEKLITSETCL